MTLRARLLVALGVLAAVFAVSAAVIIGIQRSHLTDEIDRQLDSARPFAARPTRLPPPPPSADGEPTESSVDEGSELPESPISEMYIGSVDTVGAVSTLERGELLNDTPDLAGESNLLEQLGHETPFTVGGTDGSGSFRVIGVTDDETGNWTVIALPLDGVDDAIQRLIMTLVIAGAVMVVLLGVTVWWVERLGLRPIVRLTAAADAITRGDRTHRVDLTDPRTEAGRLAHAFNVMLDERDETEDRLRRFVADASHELRTPITSIRGYLDLYTQGGFREHGQLDDVVRRMRQESSRMHDLVEDLLLLANLDQRRPLRSEQVDVKRLLQDAASDAQVIQPPRPVTLDLPDTDLIVIGDQFRLQQVIGALVTNALRHTTTDAEIHLHAHQDNQNTTITIADHGAGLTPDVAARVFDRFYRGETSRSRRAGGSGLGLAITKSIIDAHHGTIALHTQPGHGCRFTITLPRKPPQPKHDLETTHEPAAPATEHPDTTIRTKPHTTRGVVSKDEHQPRLHR